MNSIAINSSTVIGATGQSKGMVKPKFLSSLKKDCGEQDPISNIYDERVMKLRDTFLFDKGSCDDPESLLGKGWLEKLHGDVCTFVLNGDSNSQELEFDRDTKRVSLCSKHWVLGGMLGGMFGYVSQTILMRRDGTAFA